MNIEKPKWTPSGARRMLLVLAAVVGAVQTYAETYQFIVAGYPSENVSWTAGSMGTALSSSTRSSASAGIGLRSDKYHPLLIIIR